MHKELTLNKDERKNETVVKWKREMKYRKKKLIALYETMKSVWISKFKIWIDTVKHKEECRINVSLQVQEHVKFSFIGW